MLNINSIETISVNELTFNLILENDTSNLNDCPKDIEFTSIKNNSISKNFENTSTFNLICPNSNNKNIFEEEENSLNIIIDINNNNYLTENDNNKYLGRNPGRPKNPNNKNNRIHDKFSKDNITRKIQIHYLKFLLDFANLLIKDILFKKINSKIIKFCPLNPIFTKNITKKAVDSLKNNSIGEILRNNISPKYNSNINLYVYKEVTKSNIIKNIFKQKYLYFFNDYYKNNKTIDLSNFGFDKEFKLSNDIKLYEDLIIKKTKNNSLCDDEKYMKKMEIIIEKVFLHTPSFVICDF